MVLNREELLSKLFNIEVDSHLVSIFDINREVRSTINNIFQVFYHIRIDKQSYSSINDWRIKFIIRIIVRFNQIK